jgi:hypothetical protein
MLIKPAVGLAALVNTHTPTGYAVPLPPRIPQRIEDRAMKIKGTPFLIIQPVTQIHWLLDLAVPGHARREIHNVVADGNGLHMAFMYDTQAQTGHLVNGRVL